MENCEGCFYNPTHYTRCYKCNRVGKSVSGSSDLFVPKVVIKNLIKEASDYIEKNNTVVELKEAVKWKQSGILCTIKAKDYSDFCFDKELAFIDGTRIMVWMA